ncbi:MAG: sodium ion-translocating decarboxylase subunit beta [Magnetococcales bacterium]|nr:sodium ion-translocating decarboxylase subunit beta [Magnetococcales bacterium]
MDINPLDIFQGISTLVSSFESQPSIAFARLFLIALGCVLIYLGHKGVLEPLLMVPMGLGMAAVNAGVMFVPPSMNLPEQGDKGTLFLNPMISEGEKLTYILQVDFLQPIYIYTFSNGLIACLVFMGIGSLLDVGYIMARPFQSMFIAVCAELGTIVTYPLGVAIGLPEGAAAATSTIGGADGPMVLFASLMLAPDIFVPITVVAYLYLGLTYGGYPYLIKAMIPEHILAIPMPIEKPVRITAGQKMVFAIITCILLCLLFPVAAPLFLSVFLGVTIREAGLKDFHTLFSNTVLYGATFFLGLVLGILCEAATIMNPVVLRLLVLGIFALTVAAIGGILGGYALYFWSGKKYNPVIGIAGVSCVPTCAKVAQKSVTKVNRECIILPQAMGANISGVITSAILAAVLIALVGPLK